MTLPQKVWQGHILVWQGHIEMWQCHFFGVVFLPSPERCHGVKNDLTHQKNVFAIGKNDLATFFVARSKFVWQGHYIVWQGHFRWWQGR